MLLVVQLETTRYCFGYHYEHPFSGRQKFDGEIGGFGSECPRDMTGVESVFLTTQNCNVSVEADVTIAGRAQKNVGMIGLIDENVRIVSSIINYVDTAGSGGYSLSLIAHHQDPFNIKATNVNISLAIARAKNLVGLVSRQAAAFLLNYVRISGGATCSNTSSLLVATQVQVITARQLVTDIMLRAPYVAGLALEQFSRLDIHNSTIRVKAESNDSSKTGASAISMKQTHPTNIYHSIINATLKGKECAAIAVTQNGPIMLDTCNIIVFIEQARNASGLVVRSSAEITLNTININTTTLAVDRAAGFVIQQNAALTATNCQFKSYLKSILQAAGVVHTQEGALTITQLEMYLTIATGADPASLIYSAQNTISLENITGAVDLGADNKIAGQLISISTESFQVAKFNSVTVSVSGLNDSVVMCPCFAPHGCFKTPTLRQYCGHPNIDFDSPNQLIAQNNLLSVFNATTYNSNTQHRTQNLLYVKNFTNCGSNTACPDVNNSIINYNFQTNATNRSSNLIVSNYELATFYNRSLFYNIIINADDMHLAGINAGQTLLGGLATIVSSNTKVINCHLVGNITYNPLRSSAESKLTVGGFIARQNCDKLEFIYCTVNGSVKAYYNAGGFLGRQDRGDVFFTSCVSNTTGYEGQAMSFFIGTQNSNSSTFVNCSANGVLGPDGLRGAFVGNATENARTITIKNSNWTSENLDVQNAIGQKANGVTIIADNVKFNEKIWTPGTD